MEQSRAHQAAIEEESRAIDDQAAAWQRLVSQGIAAAKDPLDDYISTVEALNAALAEGAISQEQWAEAEVKANERAGGYEKQHADDLREGQRLQEQTQTAAEKYQVQLAEILRLEDAGVIDAETGRRAMEADRAAYDRATMGKGKAARETTPEGPRAELRGSDEAWATIVRSMEASRGDQGDAAEKTADNTLEAVALLRQIADKSEDEWEV